MTPSSRWRARIARPALGLTLAGTALAAGVLSGCGSTRTTTPARAPEFLAASTLPPQIVGRPAARFRLPDGRSGTLESSELGGRPYALTFLYTHCPDVCPLIGAEIHTALAALGAEERQINIVAVSVDPTRDTRGAVRAWLARHHEPANFHYLIGTYRQLRPVWKAYYAAAQNPRDPQSAHNASIWLIDRHGKIAALIDAGIPIKVGNLTHDFRVLIHTP